MLVLCIGGPLDGEEREVREPPPPTYNFTVAVPHVTKPYGQDEQYATKRYPLYQYQRVALHDARGEYFVYVSADTTREGVISRLILNYNPRVPRDSVLLWQRLVTWGRSADLKPSDMTELFALIKSSERPV